MSLTIEGPSPADTRSRNADFLELSALLSPRGRASRGTLLGVQDIADDTAAVEDTFDAETGEVLDEAIIEAERGRIVEAAFDELSYRASCLAGSYPYELDLATETIRCREEPRLTNIGGVTYLFCLLASAMRESRLVPTTDLGGLVLRIANNFQICSCLAAGGYISGDVASFGFPRATGDAFHPALRETFKRFGVGQVRQIVDIPEGLPTELKDGGIDVIAWRDLPDRMPGKIYLLGQCASGKNWREKSVVEYVPQLHGSWFTMIPANFWVPAMFIPFPLHHDLDEATDVLFPQKIHTRYWNEEMRFGIVFDRLRVSHLADLCMRAPLDARKRVDGFDRFDEVKTWIRDAMAVISPEVVLQ